MLSPSNAPSTEPWTTSRKRKCKPSWIQIEINSRTAIRDRALLLLLYNTGARASEVVELKVGDLRLDGIGQVELLGKGRKHRACPLWPETVAALRAYLNNALPNSPQPSSCSLTPMGFLSPALASATSPPNTRPPPSIAARLINTKTVSPHTLRHTTAMHLLRSGNDVNMVSYWLGHVDINTTHIYLEIDMEMKRKMIEKADAPAIKIKAAWHKPDVLQWLNALGKAPELCAVNWQKMKNNPQIKELNFT